MRVVCRRQDLCLCLPVCLTSSASVYERGGGRRGGSRRELHRARHAARVKARPGLDVRTHSRGHVLRQGLLQTLVQTGLPQLPPCVRVGLPQRRV